MDHVRNEAERGSFHGAQAYASLEADRSTRPEWVGAVDRQSSLNLEVTPQLTEAVEHYFMQEGEKLRQTQAEVVLLEWAEDFRKMGARIPAESTDPVEQERRQDVLSRLQMLGYQESDQAEVTPANLSFTLNSRVIKLCMDARRIYADPVLPVTFISAEEATAASKLDQRVQMLFTAVKAGSTEQGVITGGIDQYEVSPRRADGTSRSKLIDPEHTKAEVLELVDSSQTLYTHTTNFLDQIIASKALKPRNDAGVATTSSSSFGVHFSREMRDTPRFGFDGPGLGDYLRSTGQTQADLLRAEVMMPLGAIIEQAPIRAENSTPMYSYSSKLDNSVGVMAINMERPDSLAYIAAGAKQLDSSGVVRKQAGDTLFFASEDPAQANDYALPLEKAYIIVKDKIDSDRAIGLLQEAGYSADWIAEHVVTSRQGDGVRVVRERLERQPDKQLVAPLQVKHPPAEYRDYTSGYQYATTVELTTLRHGQFTGLTQAQDGV
jgi:hypothetical protein